GSARSPLSVVAVILGILLLVNGVFMIMAWAAGPGGLKYQVTLSNADAVAQANKLKDELGRIDGVVVTVQDQSKTTMAPNGKFWVGIEADDGLASEFADNVKQFRTRGLKYSAVKEPVNNGLVEVHLNRDFPSIEKAEKAEQELETVSRGMLKAKIRQALSKQTVKQAELDITVPSEGKAEDVRKIVTGHKLELKPVDQ
ncbi:MAG: hypothetical protein ACYCW6_29395, partial [Candidatus Xenobia bacterium]